MVDWTQMDVLAGRKDTTIILTCDSGGSQFRHTESQRMHTLSSFKAAKKVGLVERISQRVVTTCRNVAFLVCMSNVQDSC